MSFALSTRKTDPYVLIKAAGDISNIDEWKALTQRYYEEIARSNIRRALIDERELKVPHSLTQQIKLVEFYSESLPSEVSTWHIAVVVAKDNAEIGRFWETASWNRGFRNFRVFTDKQAAEAWLGT